MFYYCVARLQPVTGLIYSLVTCNSWVMFAIWLPQSRSQWSSALDCYGGHRSGKT